MNIIRLILPTFAASSLSAMTFIALFTIIRTDRNMLLACYSHKHISYRIRTIIRKAILCRREPSYCCGISAANK
ncbi:hypothetical protein [Wolbachia endosymbiont (group A) of Scambus nigricans]|uniref:hypothetical protein n=1 Tax=Wolbachia endosymbiont (group A) of Scambus nigricans TaxID=2954055 RepID=UPI00222E3FB0|nr:hypothetical protein [Wolbachia endosymbiont (group A) of Scambus nigricans]